MHPNQHEAMKNRTPEDWWVDSWNAAKGKFHSHPNSGAVEVNLKCQRVGAAGAGRLCRAGILLSSM